MSAPEVEIRPARPEDALAIVALYLRESGRQLSPERIADYLRELPAAVAHDAGELIGFAFCIPFAPDVVELGNLMVAAGDRGSGVGMRLVRTVEGLAAGLFK